jgi:alpha-1,3-rhamnosyl/mannosyltransferase
MARIGFDARMLHRTGIGTYVTEMLQRLPAAMASNQQLVVFTAGPDANAIKPHLRGSDEVVAVSPRIYGPEEQVTLRLAYGRARLDLLHAPHYNQPIRPGRMLLTINDLIPLVFPQLQGNVVAGGVNRFLLKSAVARAVRLIVPSAHTAQDLQTRLQIKDERIVVIPDAAGPQYRPERDRDAEQRLLRQLGISAPYLLYAGQWKPYKNVPLLIDAFKELAGRDSDLQLVIGGREDPRYPEIKAAAASDQRIRIPGWLPADALPHLFRAAAAFVMPSVYEGFGLPVLEAMASGTPVVCARATSLPEVAGDAAEYWEPESGREGLIAAMRRVLEPQTASRLRGAGLAQAARFSWDTTVQRTVEVYRSLLS